MGTGLRSILVLTILLGTRAHAQKAADWDRSDFPDHAIFNGINDQNCDETLDTRRGCLNQLSVLAQAASGGREFLITRPQLDDAVELVDDGHGPVLGSPDLLLVTYSEAGLGRLRALEGNDPAEVRRRMNHEDALRAALVRAGATPVIGFRDVRDRLLARAVYPPRQVAANQVVRLLALEDPYLRLFEPIANASESFLNFELRPDGERLSLARVGPLTNLDRAGLGIGDVVQRVNGMDLNTKNVNLVFDRVPRADKVRLSLQKLDGTVVDVEVPQQEQDWQVVRSFVIDVNARRVGVIVIETFADTRVCAQVETHLTALANRGVDALVYDLRGNPGGYVDQAKCFLGLNFGPGRVVARERVLTDTTTYRHQLKGAVDEVMDLVTDRARVAPSVPVVTLIDARTTSASELVAATLQEQEFSWIVGDRSYGKGVAQAVLPLLPGHDVLSFKTTSRFDLLNGSSVQGRGVAPEFEVPSAAAPWTDDYEPPRFNEEHGEAFTTPGISVRRGRARRAAHREVRRCVPRTELHVDEITARWLRDRQLAGAVAVGLCAGTPAAAAGLR